jgi:SpoVK/Ycf46/Vps4 family AAA+-type ATPase
MFKSSLKHVDPKLVSPEELTARAKAAQWLARIIEIGPSINKNIGFLLSYIFDDIDYIINKLKIVVDSVPKNLYKKQILLKFDIYFKSKVTNNNDTTIEDDDCDDDDSLDIKITKFFSIINEISSNNNILRKHISKCIIKECNFFVKQYCNYSAKFLFARNNLKKVFGVSKVVIDILEFLYINYHYSIIYKFFLSNLSILEYQNRHLLAKVLNIDMFKLQEHISAAISCCLISDRSDLTLNSEISEFWDNSRNLNVESLFCRPLTGRGLPLRNFRVPAEDIAHVKALLARPGPAPVHVLLYGAPGTGKTSFARSLASALRVKAWSVASRFDDDGDARRSSLVACLNMASKSKGGFALVDEAERLLDTGRGTFSTETQDKAWINSVLEAPGNRIVWITNHVEHIDHAVRRRFQFSVHFKELGRGERLEIWNQILKAKKARRFLPGAEVGALVDGYDVPPAVIEEAVAQAKDLAPRRPDFNLAVERVLKAYQVLRGGGRRVPVRGRGVPKFDLGGVCLKSSVDGLMDHCRRLDSRLRGREEVQPGGGTFLFYGPPGTGKSALARHIAETLGRECRLIRASDLLDCYVGETEKRISRNFQNMEADGAVLVVDEVDSFLFGRDQAVRSWETSMVNEFLTSLEECRGICFCTTNRRGNLDMAAMRRFSFKYEFGYATRAQLVALYRALLAPIAGGPPDEDEESDLVSMARLTPGDFHVVRSKYWLSDPGSVGHRELIKALRLEEGLKLEGARSIGF